MPKPITISFIDPKGIRTACIAEPGTTIMDVAMAAGINGITGQCGGAINCATCVCNIPPSWWRHLAAMSPDERELLSYVETATAESRLSCQIIASHELDGLVLQVVDTLNTQETPSTDP